uniref:Glyceraldehyde-3-phosphate dehydrogenase (GAPDH) ) n=1 Tax=Ganoderma boninense TaxID=34458 RepID=A0A5K1K675_9APHY|nr:Glyceraldehyde-3-phosphate dehydrogenase (GAPDH) (EC (NAD-dependent glyceraldehyde-3-phosphate dehydrogenase) [Ganoderma boninense]
MAALDFHIPPPPKPFYTIPEQLDDTLLSKISATTDGLLGFTSKASAKMASCGCVGGCGMVDNALWMTEEDSLPPTLEGTKPLPCTRPGFGREIGNLEQAAPPTNTPPTPEVDHHVQPDDDDQEVTFDWDEDTPGIVWLSRLGKDDGEDDPVEEEDEDGLEEGEDDTSTEEDTDIRKKHFLQSCH